MGRRRKISLITLQNRPVIYFSVSTSKTDFELFFFRELYLSVRSVGILIPKSDYITPLQVNIE